MELPDKIFFKIGEVSDIVGVKPYVLRYWETEFSFSPHKSGAGQRLYRRKEVERFLLIKRLLYSEGYTIAGARKFLAKPGKSAPESEPLTGDSAPVHGEAEAPEAVLEDAVFGEDGHPDAVAEMAPESGVASGPNPEWLVAVREEAEAIQSLIRTARSLKV